MNSKNEKENSQQVTAAYIAGIFGIVGICTTGFFAIFNTLINKDVFAFGINTPTSSPASYQTQNPVSTSTYYVDFLTPDKSTPSPASTPIPTILPAMIVSNNTLTSSGFIYDNFDNTTYNGSFNRQLWVLKNVSGGQAAQGNRILEFSYNGVPKGGIGLVTNIYDLFTSEESVFFEAQLKVDNPQDGHVYILINNSGLSTYTDCMLGYGEKTAWFSCNYVDDGQARYTAESKQVDYKKWHTVRIELDSNLMTYTYFLNNEIIGSYKPTTAKPQVSFQFGVYAVSTNNINGYVDNIHIGTLNK